MSVTKVVLLLTYWKKKIIFQEFQLIFDNKIDFENKKSLKFDGSLLSHFVK